MRYRCLLTLIVVIAAFVMDVSPCAQAKPLTEINQALALGAGEIGLTPEAIIVSGLGASSATILQNLTSAQALCATLTGQRDDLSVAVATKSLREAALSSEPDDPNLQQEYEVALVAWQEAVVAVESTHEALFSQVMTGISEIDRQRYEIFQQSDGRRAPAAFRVKARTESEWQDIELALIAETRAQFLGQPFGGAQAQILAGVRGEIGVVAAQAALDANLPAMQAAFIAALEPGSP